jgi:hypothetical protein
LTSADRTRYAAVALVLAGFAAAYLTLSLWLLPQNVQTPDSASYFVLNFFGHQQRLWTVPLFYKIGHTPVGAVVVQSLIALGAWTALAIELTKAIHSRVIGYVAAIFTLLMALTPPLLDWNRAILSESISLSMTVLLVVGTSRFVRQRTGRSLALLFLAAILWVFTRQDQALIAAVLAVPFLVLAIRPTKRRLALVAAAGFVVIGAWGAITSEQSGSDQLKPIAAASLVQWRAVGHHSEFIYLIEQGMPLPAALQPVVPLTSAGDPVGIDQFSDAGLLGPIANDAAFNYWGVHHAQSEFLRYLIRHPAFALGPPLRHVAQLMTMNADYAPGPALPVSLSQVVYGDRSVDGSAFSGGGAASSDDPAYLYVLAGIAIALFAAAAFKRRVTGAAMIGLGGLLFSLVWGIEVWNGSTQELPRLFVLPATLCHLSLLLLIAGSLDGLGES